MNIEITLTEPQERFVFSEAAHPGMVAGYGAGKSQAGVVRLLLLALRYPRMNFAFVEPTFDLVRLIAWPRFTELLDTWGLRHTLNKSTSILELHNGATVIFRSGDSPERMVGFEVADAVIDEIDTLRPQQAGEVWTKMLGRARQKKPDGMPNTVAAVSTPEGFGWMYETFGKDLKPGYELIRAPTSSNPYLPPGYLDQLRATYSSAQLQAYCDGIFVNLTSGSIYHEFDRHLNGCDTRIQPSEPLHIGLDFNVTNCSAAVFVLRDGNPHAVDEITGVLDTPAMIAVIKARYEGHAIFVYPDASGGGRRSNNASESDIALLRAARFTVLAPSANPPVKNRILAMNGMIHSQGVRRLRVNADYCPALVEALEKQAYDKNGEPDKKSGLDHMCFAGETLVETPAGLVRFDQLPRTGLVRGPDGQFTRYINAGKTGVKQLVRVAFGNGYFIDCTSDHLFLTEDGSWVQAKDLVGHVCVSSVTASKSLRVGNIIYPGSILPIRPHRSAGCIGQSGLPTMARSLTGAISIISTMIAATTRSRTWNALWRAAIIPITATFNAPGWLRWAHAISTSPSNGTLPMKGEHGTGSTMPKQRQPFMQKWLGFVSSAAQAFKRGEGQCIAAMPARPMHAGRAALTMLTATAFNAGRNSKQIAIARANAVANVSLLGVQDVYCLTVPEFGAFKLTADSPIVSNCDACGYYVSYRFPIAGRTIQRVSIGGI